MAKRFKRPKWGRRRKPPAIRQKTFVKMAAAIKEAGERFQEDFDSLAAHDFSLEYLRREPPVRICGTIVALRMTGDLAGGERAEFVDSHYVPYIRQLEAEARQILDEKLTEEQRRGGLYERLIDAGIEEMRGRGDPGRR